MTNRLEFDGPSNWHCMGVRYVTLTHAGIKEEGEPFKFQCDDRQEALNLFFVELDKYASGADQLAWRRHATAEEYRGKWVVSARVARFPEVTE